MVNIRESCWSQWQPTLTTRYSLAFAVVDCESGSNWRWFLQCLRDMIGHVIPDEGICIISNRHLGIKNAIANWPRRDDGRTQVFHRYCL